jgi:hypothetical protein
MSLFICGLSKSFVILALLILILSPVIILRMPVDIFPDINIPVIAISWTYTEELEGRVTLPYEKALTTSVENIEHIESTTYNGLDVDQGLPSAWGKRRHGECPDHGDIAVDSQAVPEVYQSVLKSVRTVSISSDAYPRERFRGKIAGDLLPVPFLLAGGEVIYIALHAVQLAGSFHRVNAVIVGFPRLYVLQQHAEHRIGMVLIQPDVTLRSQVQVVRISPVLHKPKVLVRAARVVACPSDNGLVVPKQFEGWSFSNMHLCRSPCRGWGVVSRVM